MKWTPAKQDHVGLGLLRRLRELERVADEVGEVLDLALLVVVREDDRVALALQAPDLVFEVHVGLNVGRRPRGIQVEAGIGAGFSSVFGSLLR